MYFLLYFILDTKFPSAKKKKVFLPWEGDSNRITLFARPFSTYWRMNIFGIIVFTDLFWRSFNQPISFRRDSIFAYRTPAAIKPAFDGQTFLSLVARWSPMTGVLGEFLERLAWILLLLLNTTSSYLLIFQTRWIRWSTNGRQWRKTTSLNRAKICRLPENPACWVPRSAVSIPLTVVMRRRAHGKTFTGRKMVRPVITIRFTRLRDIVVVIITRQLRTLHHNKYFVLAFLKRVSF